MLSARDPAQNKSYIQAEGEGMEKLFRANEHTTLMGHSDSSPEREVHSITGLPKKNRNISNKQLDLTATGTRGTTTNKAQSEEKEGNNQDQS